MAKAEVVVVEPTITVQFNEAELKYIVAVMAVQPSCIIRDGNRSGNLYSTLLEAARRVDKSFSGVDEAQYYGLVNPNG